jgi:hypothetical protein
MGQYGARVHGAQALQVAGHGGVHAAWYGWCIGGETELIKERAA